jgi:nicotinate-nucleotide adenylyltransferase
MELERIYPGTEFSLVLGTDALRNIQSWHRLDELIEKVEFLQLLRSGESVNEAQLPAGIEVNLVQGAMLDISSTLIREKVAKSEDVSELVDSKILDLVKGIYGA